MDLHILPGVTAKGVAEAHREDLLIQEKFNCNCMTYWIDEAKESVFCLIEAPDANAVRELHNNAHGLTPHQIIQVNPNIVESFLGRLYDPENYHTENDNLKVFNDPAYRILVFIKKLHPVLLEKKFGTDHERDLNNLYHQAVNNSAREFEGEVAEHNENITTILSFTSSSKAIKCALGIQNFFTRDQKEMFDLKISINSGLPVTTCSRIFGETIDFGKILFYVAKPDRIGVAPGIKDIPAQNFERGGGLLSISSSEEKFLNQIIKVIEINSGDESFGIENFCDQMGMSKSSLNRGIRSLTGKSPNILIKEYRLNKGLDLLLERNHTVSEISFIAGFRSPSYFSKCFKEYYNISPSAFFEKIKE